MGNEAVEKVKHNIIFFGCAFLAGVVTNFSASVCAVRKLSGWVKDSHRTNAMRRRL